MPIWLLIYLLCGSIYMAMLHISGYMISRRKDFIPRTESKPLPVALVANIVGIILFPILIIVFTYGMLSLEQQQRHMLKQLERLRDFIIEKEEPKNERQT